MTNPISGYTSTVLGASGNSTTKESTDELPMPELPGVASRTKARKKVASSSRGRASTILSTGLG